MSWIEKNLKRADEILKIRNQRGRRFFSQRVMTDEQHLDGILAEIKLEEETGWPLRDSDCAGGDGGCDIETDLAVLDVKSFTVRRSYEGALASGHLLVEVERIHVVAIGKPVIYVAALQYDGEVELIGWEWAYDMLKCEKAYHHDTHKILSYRKQYGLLHPMSQLYDFIGPGPLKLQRKTA